jgi:hypothetical protein
VRPFDLHAFTDSALKDEVSGTGGAGNTARLDPLWAGDMLVDQVC